MKDLIAGDGKSEHLASGTFWKIQHYNILVNCSVFNYLIFNLDQFS